MEPQKPQIPVRQNPDTSPPNLAAAKACAYIGPVTVQKSRDHVIRWIKKHGASVNEIERETERHFTMIYVPPLKSMRDAKIRQRELKALGIEDIALIRAGRLIHGISLGVFSNPASVKHRQAALARKGIQTETTIRAHTQKQRWLHITADKPIDDGALKKQFPNLRMIQTPCEANS